MSFAPRDCTAAGLRACVPDAALRLTAQRRDGPTVLSALQATTIRSLVPALAWLVPLATINHLVGLTRAPLVLLEPSFKVQGPSFVQLVLQVNTRKTPERQRVSRALRARTVGLQHRLAPHVMLASFNQALGATLVLRALKASSL